MWKTGNDSFQLTTPIESVPLRSLMSLRLVFSELDWSPSRQKVCRVRIVGDISGTKYIFKTIERSPTGWKHLYHELRQLLCMPRHPNILGPPESLIYMHLGNIEVIDMAGDVLNGEIRLPICGFLLQEVEGITLMKELEQCYEPAHKTQTCRCFRGLARERLVAKWCRQLAETQLHLLKHGNGLNRPGFYSDLKPNNIMITHSGRDIVLIDFESNGNWKGYRAEETHDTTVYDTSEDFQYCTRCRIMGISAKSYEKPEDHDDVYRHSTDQSRPNLYWPRLTSGDREHLNKCPAHWNNSCTNPRGRPNTPSLLYSNPPWGYYKPFWTKASHGAKEKAMVHALCYNCHELVMGGPNPSRTIRGSFKYPIKVRLREELLAKWPHQRTSLRGMLHEFKLWEEAAIKRENLMLERMQADALIPASARWDAMLADFRAAQEKDLAALTNGMAC
ncbi:hypothetical protein FN846DRAFT_906461 [Sphaerosporella brunnea]|uniref:Protein kinase domain-containing protein n=1 Tax=Sphaerosporella brunnea TaxID=1250544 RepID=A0A5J5EZJ0_9PEZI|nr:hypothetical protein FN846DRAFT_906461 [Sphaerosporella brunnea]